MKKMVKAGIAALLLLAGCTADPSGQSSGQADSGSEVKPVYGDSMALYKESLAGMKESGSVTSAVNSMYKMHFSDDTYDTYSFDGTLETNGSDAHIRENFLANGMASVIEGYYYGGRLYNVYNGVSYYEDMSMDELKQTLLVPLTPVDPAEEDVADITVMDRENGDRIYRLTLKDEAAQKLFHQRYDFYDLSKYDGYVLKSHTLTEEFDKEGRFIREAAVFESEITYGKETIEVQFSSETNQLRFDETTVTITDEQKKEQSAYVNFKDIDTDAITPETADDDSEEATVTATFEKRLKSRLNYKEQEDGTLKSEFNENESYVIDFANNSFMYSNYSIHYTYNWKGDIGAMGACTYDYKTEHASSECTDSTIETVQKVRMYLQMELYYCGLSLEDLQNESR